MSWQLKSTTFAASEAGGGGTGGNNDETNKVSRNDLPTAIHGIQPVTIASQAGVPLGTPATQVTSGTPVTATGAGKGDPLDLPPGAVLGKYRIESCLGFGGMGVVYRATDVRLDREVALKLMKPELSRDRAFRDRFLREAKVAARINDPHVVTIHDADELNGILFMAFEFVPGGDLSERIEREGPLSPDEAMRILMGCAQGLLAIHQAGLVHRDIKPQNIFLDGQGRAKLGDLGLARSSSGNDRVTMTGTSMGTPAYMSPEQAQGIADIDIRADIHALGGTLYTLLTGQPPYSGPTMWAVVHKVMDMNGAVPDASKDRKGVPEAISRVALKALSKRREDRHQTPAELLRDCQHALALSTALPVVAAAKPHARAPFLIAGAVALLAVVAVVAWIVGRAGQQQAPAQTASAPVAAAPTVVAAQAAPVAAPVVAAPAAAAPVAAAAAATGALNPTQRPAWAADAGSDQYGLWADLKVEQAVQRFRWVKPGTFSMGSRNSEPNRKEDETYHQVTFTHGFWLGDSEVTQDLWQNVTGTNPSEFKGEPTRPVETVSWIDCREFLSTLNSRVVGLNATFPSEAQWEYACRAGTTGPTAGDLGVMAWFEQNSFKQPHPVKAKAPNAWGLYDMHGNVWEWCADWQGDLSESPQQDPQGPESGANRVVRGGAWSDAAKHSRSAFRNGDYPGNRGNDQGFRIAIPAR